MNEQNCFQAMVEVVKVLIFRSDVFSLRSMVAECSTFKTSMGDRKYYFRMMSRSPQLLPVKKRETACFARDPGLRFHLAGPSAESVIFRLQNAENSLVLNQKLIMYFTNIYHVHSQICFIYVSQRSDSPS